MLEIFEDITLPVVLRVENIFSNSRNFSDAFGCSVGSEMNPRSNDDRLAVFPYLQSGENSGEDDKSYGDVYSK